MYGQLRAWITTENSVTILVHTHTHLKNDSKYWNKAFMDKFTFFSAAYEGYIQRWAKVTDASP